MPPESIAYFLDSEDSRFHRVGEIGDHNYGADVGKSEVCANTGAPDKLLRGKMPFAHEPADHAEIDRPLAASLPAAAIAVPVAPQECIDIPVAEPVDSLGHLALEGEPPHFAVGHDVKARSLLQRNGLIDGAILNGLELRVTKTPGHPVVPRFAQCDRPEKTADNVGMCRNHRTPVLTAWGSTTLSKRRFGNASSGLDKPAFAVEGLAVEPRNKPIGN